jgi:hypothetical protein
MTRVPSGLSKSAAGFEQRIMNKTRQICRSIVSKIASIKADLGTFWDQNGTPGGSLTAFSVETALRDSPTWPIAYAGCLPIAGLRGLAWPGSLLFLGSLSLRIGSWMGFGGRTLLWPLLGRLRSLGVRGIGDRMDVLASEPGVGVGASFFDRFLGSF